MLNSSDILRGYTDTIILAQLAGGDSYGYVISKNVQEITRGELQLKEATLYTTFRRLESAGYILGYQAQLSCAAMGYQIKAFINLEIEPSQKPEFYPYIEGCPNVMECNCVTGDYSMFIKVCFHTTQELDQFINQLHRFGRTRTQIVFSTPVEHRGIPAMDPEENE